MCHLDPVPAGNQLQQGEEPSLAQHVPNSPQIPVRLGYYFLGLEESSVLLEADDMQMEM